MENTGGGSSSTGSNFVSVIRFSGSSKAPPASQPSSQSHKVLEGSVGKLGAQDASESAEDVEGEKENHMLQLNASCIDMHVKKHEYEQACFKYFLEKSKLEKMGITGEIHNNSGPQAIAHCSTSQPNPFLMMPALTQLNPQVAPTVPMLSTNVSSKHAVDSDKEPEIFCKCGLSFSTRRNLLDHIKYHTMPMNFQCSICGIRKFGLNQLRSHVKATHGVATSDMASTKGCRLCGRVVDTLAQLHEHRRTEHPRRVSVK